MLLLFCCYKMCGTEMGFIYYNYHYWVGYDFFIIIIFTPLPTTVSDNLWNLNVHLAQNNNDNNNNKINTNNNSNNNINKNNYNNKNNNNNNNNNPTLYLSCLSRALTMSLLMYSVLLSDLRNVTKYGSSPLPGTWTPTAPWLVTAISGSDFCHYLSLLFLVI